MRFFDNSVKRREGRAVSLVKHPSYSTKLEVNALLNMKAILDRLKGFRKSLLKITFAPIMTEFLVFSSAKGCCFCFVKIVHFRCKL